MTDNLNSELQSKLLDIANLQQVAKKISVEMNEDDWQQQSSQVETLLRSANADLQSVMRELRV